MFRRNLLKGILFSLVVVIIGFGLLYRNMIHKPVVANPIVLEINKGESFGNISAKLISAGLEINPIWLKLLALQKGVVNKLKTGEYEIPSGATISQILDIIVQGKAKKYAITFPEGWSLKEILKQLEATPNITKTISNQSSPDVAKALDIKENNAEGWLFPDTYYFEKNATDMSILQRAYEKMKVVLNEEWNKKNADLPYKSAYDALIMASIVEKETGVKSERPRIASVFVNRLRKKMLLQTDPTVIYGMGDKYQGNIRAADLHKATPYNTYVIRGLPPTPIAMPGREAIRASLNPNQEESLYFVAKGDGSHQFSVSLNDHNRAVNVFQKKINAQ